MGASFFLSKDLLIDLLIVDKNLKIIYNIYNNKISPRRKDSG